MDDWLAGLSTGYFHQQSILSCLENIKNGGFNSIEVCSAPSHLDYHNSADVIKAHALIREVGMNVYSFHAPFAEYIDISSSSNSVHRNALEEIHMAADAARRGKQYLEDILRRAALSHRGDL